MCQTQRAFLILLPILLVASEGITAQQLPQASAEFQINEYVDGYQWEPAIAIAGEEIWVAWQSEDADNGEMDGSNIQARRFDLYGAPKAGQFRVNSTTEEHQGAPAVAAMPNGETIVVWSDPSGIHGQRYDAAGAPLGGQFQINDPLGPPSNSDPAIAIDTSGNYLVAWHRVDPISGFYFSYSIHGQRFTADGTPDGSPFQISSAPLYPQNWQRYPVLASDDSGRFLVAWESLGSDPDDTIGYSVQARLYGADGEPLGPEFRVNNTSTLYDQRYPAVAMSPEGDFLVVWQDEDPDHNGDGDGSGVRGRHFRSDGSPFGDAFTINSFTYGEQYLPAVALDISGDFFIVWTSSAYSDSARGTIEFTDSIQGRWLSADGTFVGDQFLVSDPTSLRDTVPVIAPNRAGQFALAWYADEAPGSLDSDLQGRVFSTLLFRDGFESGDLDMWTAHEQ